MAEVYTEHSFSGLLVKINADVGGEIGGKIFLIPENFLKDFVFIPATKNQDDVARQIEFDAQMDKKLIRVDYAVFKEDFTSRGSAGG